MEEKSTIQKYNIYKLIEPNTEEIRYIGITFTTLKKRLGGHMNDKSNNHKCNWINKLKKNNTKPIIELIEEGENTFEYTSNREIYWIAYYKEKGANLTNSTTGGIRNYLIFDDIRKKISEICKLKFKIQKNRDILKISNKRYEDSKSEEQKLKDIDVQKCKTVYQYTLNMEFVASYPSLNNASKVNNLFKRNISISCKRYDRTTGGYIWRFEGDLTPLQQSNTKPALYKAIKQYSLDGVFITEYKSIKEASDELNICNSGIVACCKNKQSSANGFIFSYANEDIPDAYVKNLTGKKVIQKDLNNIFIKKYTSIEQASKENNILSAHISKCCYGKLSKVGDYFWHFEGDDRIYEEMEMVNKNHRSVNQYDKNCNFIATYKTISAAVKTTGILKGSIIWCCKKRQKYAGDFIFTYSDMPAPDSYIIIKPGKKINKYDLNNDFIEKYVSAVQAAKENNLSRKTIIQCCLNKKKNYGGFIWQYA